MIKYVTIKDTKVAFQITRKGLLYHIKIAYFIGGRAIHVKTVKKLFGLRSYLWDLIDKEILCGVDLDEITIYNYTSRDLEFYGTTYYRLDKRFIKYFDR